MNQLLMAETQWAVAGTMREEFRRDLLNGLSGSQKTLPCKYLYDEEGARLFEAICQVEEYYPTRTEMSILRQHIKEIAALLGPRCNLLELGSGNSMKTRLLLDHLDAPATYIPVDVARNQLLKSCASLAREYPSLAVLPVCGDFTNHFELPEGFGRLVTSPDTNIFFPGSTIGNFEPDEAESFLRRMAGLCGADGGLLLGVDLKKDTRALHRAYNDAQGVTAAFNLNVLARANRELQAGFDLAQFEHAASYNEAAGRIEMRLASRKSQQARVADREFWLAKGESIRTEHSYKYHIKEFQELAGRAGWRVARCWTDEKQWFSVQYLLPET